jgi:hypothetical protein
LGRFASASRNVKGENIDLEKLELFAGQFYPVIPNMGHNSRKSCSKRFEFSTLGATNGPFWAETVRFGQFWHRKDQKGTKISS